MERGTAYDNTIQQYTKILLSPSRVMCGVPVDTREQMEGKVWSCTLMMLICDCVRGNQPYVGKQNFPGFA